MQKIVFCYQNEYLHIYVCICIRNAGAVSLKIILPNAVLPNNILTCGIPQISSMFLFWSGSRQGLLKRSYGGWGFLDITVFVKVISRPRFGWCLSFLKKHFIVLLCLKKDLNASLIRNLFQYSGGGFHFISTQVRKYIQNLILKYFLDSIF